MFVCILCVSVRALVSLFPHSSPYRSSMNIFCRATLSGTTAMELCFYLLLASNLSRLYSIRLIHQHCAKNAHTHTHRHKRFGWAGKSAAPFEEHPQMKSVLFPFSLVVKFGNFDDAIKSTQHRHMHIRTRTRTHTHAPHRRTPSLFATEINLRQATSQMEEYIQCVDCVSTVRYIRGPSQRKKKRMLSNRFVACSLLQPYEC